MRKGYKPGFSLSLLCIGQTTCSVILIKLNRRYAELNADRTPTEEGRYFDF